MRICFVTIDSHVSGNGGGIASYVRTISQALIARGHIVHVVTFGKSARTWEKDGVHIHEVAKPQIHWYMHRLLPIGKEWALPVREIEWSHALWREVRKIVDRERIDLIETTEMGNYWRRFLRNLPPIVVRAHGNSLAIKKSYARPNLAEGLDRWLELLGMAGIAAVTAPSQFAARSIQAELSNTTIPVHVIPNPLDQTIECNARNWKPQYKTGPHILLYTGRIEYCKGTLTLLEALPHIIKEIPDVKLVIAGGRHPTISDEMLRRYTSAIHPNNLLLLGHQPMSELIEWYKRAAVFVMPSYYETFGISVIEAMAFGLPVVATTAGALPEVVEDGGTGIIVEPGNPEILAEAITRLLGDLEFRRCTKHAGRERVLSLYTTDRVADQTLALYERIRERSIGDTHI